MLARPTSLLVQFHRHVLHLVHSICFYTLRMMVFARNFWQTLRRSLPKFRQRRQGFDPLNIEPLEDQWMPHFMQLEVGEARSPVDVLQECHRRQCQTKPAQTQLSITELPLIGAVRRCSTSSSTAQSHRPRCLAVSSIPQQCLWSCACFLPPPFENGGMATGTYCREREGHLPSATKKGVSTLQATIVVSCCCPHSPNGYMRCSESNWWHC